MMLWLGLILFAASLFSLSIDRKLAQYCRERLAKPAFQLALKITDWAKGGPWIGAAALFYLATQIWIIAVAETPVVRAVSDYALALLVSFLIGSVVLHVI